MHCYEILIRFRCLSNLNSSHRPAQLCYWLSVSDLILVFLWSSLKPSHWCGRWIIEALSSRLLTLHVDSSLGSGESKSLSTGKFHWSELTSLKRSWFFFESLPLRLRLMSDQAMNVKQGGSYINILATGQKLFPLNGPFKRSSADGKNCEIGGF